MRRRAVRRRKGFVFRAGAVRAKVTDATMAGNMQTWAAVGHPCVPGSIADLFP